MKAIYSIINKINGHQYVGSARNFYKRKALHLRQLQNKTHHSKYLQNAFDKYGEDYFQFVILEKISNEDELLVREQWWIDNSHCEYNMCKVAGSSLGLKRSQETKDKLSKIHSGKKHPQWRNEIKSKSQSGENHWAFNKKLSENTKKKKSESMKRYYESHENSNKRAILKFNLQNELLEEFDSITSAANNNQSMRKAISKCLNGKSKTSNNFIWKYKTNM